MFYRLTFAFIFCILAVSAQNLEKCTGPASDSQEDFKWKYDAAPIVAFGKVAEVRNTKVIFTVSCTLKGDLPLSTLELDQLPNVLNASECHYLAANKQYIVFLESSKPDTKTVYRLADMEEIEVTGDTVKNFMEEECADEDDFGIEMTMWYYGNNVQCKQFTATCNQATRTSILALDYPPLTSSTTFLGGYKKVLPVPSMSNNGISGKQGGSDDSNLNNAATTVSLFMPIVIFVTGLMMKFSL